jgi:hypothetical protein
LLESFGCNIPVNSRSEQFSPIAYGMTAYSKTAYAFYSLRQYMSDDVYDSAMHLLFKEFAFKHPYPEDVKRVFSKYYGEDLSWFFDTILGTTYIQDYKIKQLKYLTGGIKDGQTIDTICFSYKKKGKIPAPVYASISRKNGLTYTLLDDYISRKKIDTSCTSMYSQIDETGKLPPPQKLELCTAADFMEMPWTNNTIYNRKFFKKLEPVKFEPIFSAQSPEFNYINYFPVAYYSLDKGFSAGIAFYNTSMYFKKWQYLLVPMFNLSKGTLMSGTAKLTRYWFTYTSKKINYIFTGISLNSFRMPFNKYENYIKTDLNTGIKIKNKYKFDKTYWKIIDHNFLLTDLTSNYHNKLNYINLLEIKYKRLHTLYPASLILSVENSANYSKAYITYSQKFKYDIKKHYVGLKLFAGKFIFNKSPNALTDFKLNGLSPYNDYLFSSTYMNMNSTPNFIDFVSYPGYFRSSDFLTGITISASTPIKPIALYFSGAYMNLHDYYADNTFTTTAYETGIEINILDDILQIRIPLAYSTHLFNGYKFDYLVSVNLNLNKLNPFEMYEETVTVRF